MQADEPSEAVLSGHAYPACTNLWARPPAIHSAIPAIPALVEAGDQEFMVLLSFREASKPELLEILPQIKQTIKHRNFPNMEGTSST